MNSDAIEEVSEEKAEKLVDALVFCAYCNEPFKECDTLIPGIGVIVGEIDVVKYGDRFWHSGCVRDFMKSKGVQP